MTVTDPDTSGPSTNEPHHFWRLVAIWAVLSAAADPLFYLLVGPHLPPGDMGSAAASDQFDSNVLFVIAIPVVFAVVIYLLYAVLVWRARPGMPEPVAGPNSHGNLAIQIAWISVSSLLVLGLFLFGTVELVTNGGRILSVTALGPTIDRARMGAYEAVDNVRFEGMQFRTDIAVVPGD